MMLTMDPPRHTQYRKLVSPRFLRSAAGRMRPRIERLAADIADGVADRDEFDLVEDVAGLLPSYVIAEMLGIPCQDGVELYRLTETLHADPASQPDGAGIAAVVEMFNYANGAKSSVHPPDRSGRALSRGGADVGRAATAERGAGAGAAARRPAPADIQLQHGPGVDQQRGGHRPAHVGTASAAVGQRQHARAPEPSRSSVPGGPRPHQAEQGADGLEPPAPSAGQFTAWSVCRVERPPEGAAHMGKHRLRRSDYLPGVGADGIGGRAAHEQDVVGRVYGDYRWRRADLAAVHHRDHGYRDHRPAEPLQGAGPTGRVEQPQCRQRWRSWRHQARRRCAGCRCRPCCLWL